MVRTSNSTLKKKKKKTEKKRKNKTKQNKTLAWKFTPLVPGLQKQR